MMTLVIGGSGSGKSAYAEEILTAISDVTDKYYLATMQVYDDDGRQKVERHQRLRQDKGFLTIEQPVNIEQSTEKMKSGEHAALLECMSNLTANEMFGETMLSVNEVTKKILAGIRQLKIEIKHLVIVSNNVFEAGIRYDEGTMAYLEALSQINRSLAAEADRVIEVVVGLPLIIKDGRMEQCVSLNR